MLRTYRFAGSALALFVLACTPLALDPIDGGTDAVVLTDTGTDAGPPMPITRPALLAANAVSESDPNYQGQLRFLWDTWGVEVNSSWPPPAFMLQLMTSEPTVFGNQYASFGFVHNPNDDFPVGLTRGIADPTQLAQTCALCHVATLQDGRVWLGAANGALRLEEFRYEVNQRWVAAGHASMLTALDITKAHELGPGRASAEGSTNPQLVPVDFPPYYNFQNRTNFTYLGAVLDLRSTVFVTVFDQGARAPFDPMSPVAWPGNARVQQMVDFLATLVGPTGPTQDATLVARGALLFDSEHCSSCHHPGHPEMDGVTTVPSDALDRLPGADAMHPSGTIGTDPLDFNLINYTGGGADPEIALRLRFLGANHLRVTLTSGYRVLGLRNIWATAPYLHNGSVPTLDALLQPAASRPATFMRGSFLVDTAVPGNSNQGHEFGTAISAADRAALVAYLLSL